MRKFVPLCVVAVSLLLLLAEPAHAQETPEQIENMDWIELIASLINFLADILAASAELLRQSVERFSEMFGSN